MVSNSCPQMIRPPQPPKVLFSTFDIDRRLKGEYNGTCRHLPIGSPFLRTECIRRHTQPGLAVIPPASSPGADT
ncbi:hypothetical protein AAY473_023765 [Plecturocebus cupreus]